MNKKTIISSLLSFAVTIILLSATIFAWITLQSQVSIEDFVVNVHDLKSDIVLVIQRNDEDPVEIKTQEDFDSVFKDALPSYRFLFKLTITNKSTRATSIKVLLNDVSNDNENEDFDMCNVFFLEDGIVTVNNINLDPLELNKEEINEEFNEYCLNNLIANKNIILVESFPLEIDESVEIMFTIIYDENTSDIEYQGGKLHIAGIYIYNN